MGNRQVIAPDDPEIYVNARKTKKEPSFLAKLFGASAEPTLSPPDLELSEDEGISTDLDKAWHGIHYLLTGAAWEGEAPLNFMIAGGTEVAGVEVGYGTARVFTAEETQEIAEALTGVSDDELKQRFKPEDMVAKDIYPEIWGRKDDEETNVEYLMEYLGVLRGFLDQTVKAGMGIAVFLS